MADIHFFNEGIKFSVDSPLIRKTWVTEVIHNHSKLSGEINFIFCSDDYLSTLNASYLEHDTFTDIITFDNSEDEQSISGDIFISIDRVKENASRLYIPFDIELSRVMIHGILHLIGYGDKSEEEKLLMRQKEDACLSLLPNK